MANIKEITKKGRCRGCGTCFAVCPKRAIKILLDQKRGINIPQVDGSKCDNCGVCLKVCPARKTNGIFGKEDILIGNHIECYSGYSRNNEVRHNASSGGIITTLLIFTLNKGIISGVLVTRGRKDNALVAESFIARNEEEILKATGSKYCPVASNVALKEIRDAKDGEKFAVVGLPCHISGVKRARHLNNNLDKKIFVTFGLFCNHTPASHAIDFFLKKVGIKKEEVVKIDYRGGGWPGYIRILKRNGQLMKYPSSLYWSIAGSSFFYPSGCLACDDCTSEAADVSFGDAWLPEFKQDKVGRSLIICRTETGRAILKEAQRNRLIELEPISLEKVISSHLGPIYLKKKGFKSFFRSPNNELIKPDLLDYLFCLPFLLNSILGKSAFFRNVLFFVPMKFISLQSSFFSRIYNKKAKRDFKKYIEKKNGRE